MLTLEDGYEARHLLPFDGIDIPCTIGNKNYILTIADDPQSQNTYYWELIIEGRMLPFIEEQATGFISMQDALDDFNAKHNNAKERIAMKKQAQEDFETAYTFKYNQCTVVIYVEHQIFAKPDIYTYDIYVHGEWVTGSKQEFANQEDAANDAIDRIEHAGFENCSKGLIAMKKQANSIENVLYQLDEINHQLDSMYMNIPYDDKIENELNDVYQRASIGIFNAKEAIKEFGAYLGH